MSKENTPNNGIIEEFSFRKVEEIIKHEEKTKDELEREIVEYMNRFFCIIIGTSAIYVQKQVRSKVNTTFFEVGPLPIPKKDIEYVFRTKQGFKEAMANKSVILKTIQTIQHRNRTRVINEEENINLYNLGTRVNIDVNLIV